jgi:hypothetical protein
MTRRANDKSKAHIHAALDRLAAAERRFVGSEFLAPVLRGTGVGVRIAGVHCRLKVEPEDFEGWGVFQAVSHTRANLIARATMSARRKYLVLFPAARLILCQQVHSQWHAIAAHRGDSRFAIEGLAPVRLVAPGEGELFDTVVARFDGGFFWFDEIDGRGDPAAAAYLRESLAAMREPRHLKRGGLTAEQRTAYALNYAQRLEEIMKDRKAAAESRLRAALDHAGADLRDYADRGDVYRVTYEVDGRRHTSVVRKDDLTVQTAGICLAGQDRNFDLASLVGVLREAGEDL